jgi:hypothetical protein
MNLFVLVSTGQKVANLPPVLEIAQPGDQILWVESQEAHERDWTAAPRAVLEQYGLVTANVARLSHVNDPFLLTTTLDLFAQSAADRYEAIYLVTNGGTKHTPIGLLHAFQSCAPRLLYGDERPAMYGIFPSGLREPPQVAPYTRHRLDLADILRLNGFTFATGSMQQRIWPDELPPDLRQERYGVDEQYTYQLHTQHYEWASVSGQEQRVRFEELSELVPEVYKRWQRTLEQLCHAMNPQNLRNTYNCTLNLGDNARRAAALRSAGVEQPSARIGDSLERAVARRVRGWLEQNPHPAVQSVWTGVKIARETQPQNVDAEFDILIVLKNGILFHLECKSANVDRRELDVNTYRLRQAGSQLARSVVVVPIFTRCAHTPWFMALHSTRFLLQDQLGHQLVLPFTWPNQPETYQLPNAEPPEQFQCDTFENGLSALLRPYRP